MLSRIMTNELYWLESIATIVNIASDWAVLPHLWDQIKLLISDELFQKLRRQMWRKGRESPTVLRTESQQTVTPRNAASLQMYDLAPRWRQPVSRTNLETWVWCMFVFIQCTPWYKPRTIEAPKQYYWTKWRIPAIVGSQTWNCKTVCTVRFYKEEVQAKIQITAVSDLSVSKFRLFMLRNFFSFCFLFVVVIFCFCFFLRQHFTV